MVRGQAADPEGAVFSLADGYDRPPATLAEAREGGVDVRRRPQGGRGLEEEQPAIRVAAGRERYQRVLDHVGHARLVRG